MDALTLHSCYYFTIRCLHYKTIKLSSLIHEFAISSVSNGACDYLPHWPGVCTHRRNWFKEFGVDSSQCAYIEKDVHWIMT